jgi:hypothetical protein
LVVGGGGGGGAEEKEAEAEEKEVQEEEEEEELGQLMLVGWLEKLKPGTAKTWQKRHFALYAAVENGKPTLTYGKNENEATKRLMKLGAVYNISDEGNGVASQSTHRQFSLEFHGTIDEDVDRYIRVCCQEGRQKVAWLAALQRADVEVRIEQDAHRNADWKESETTLSTKEAMGQRMEQKVRATRRSLRMGSAPSGPARRTSQQQGRRQSTRRSMTRKNSPLDGVSKRRSVMVRSLQASTRIDPDRYKY